MDGRQLLRTVRSRAHTRHMPVIVASSHLYGGPGQAERLRHELLTLGADHVEVKPIHSANFNQAFLRLLAGNK
jgi:CheY-like chemotaxis protein